MDAQRLDEMSDAALDRGLQALLAADPSPDYVARVREQIANAPARSRPWFSVWTLVAAIAIAIVIVAASRVGPGSAPNNVRSFLPTRPLADSGAGFGVGSLISEVRPVGTDQPRLERADRHQPAARLIEATPERLAVAEPEVLVDPREAAALRAVIFGTRDGRLDLAPVIKASTPAVMELPPLGDIEIPTITIEPIAPGTGEEGVRK